MKKPSTVSKIDTFDRRNGMVVFLFEEGTKRRIFNSMLRWTWKFHVSFCVGEFKTQLPSLSGIGNRESAIRGMLW